MDILWFRLDFKNIINNEEILKNTLLCITIHKSVLKLLLKF